MIFFQQKHLQLFLVLFYSVLLAGCATFYQQNEAFNRSFESGDLKTAHKHLDANKKMQANRNRALYLINKGTLAWMQKDYVLANTYFNEADIFIEDQRKNLGLEALAIVSNPSVRPYKPEDFENVLINFYKAISYLELNNSEQALVECRRLNEKLYDLNDKYPKDNKNRYNNDAFAHNLMGMIYEASKDYNNAFIAYRNAYNVYKDNYSKNFNTASPHQLKKDILRTAKRVGFEKEYTFYAKEFNMTHENISQDEGEIIFIWMNGLGPVKDEWSINLTANKGAGGILTFANSEEGISLPFNISSFDSNKQTAFNNLDFVRIAFPKYRERPPLFNQASIEIEGQTFILEKAEDINSIAFKCLKDRMVREISNSILRLATKKALEELAYSENNTVGSLLNIANALTEKADTRNWQTLPHSIYYSRVKLKAGDHKLTLNLKSGVNRYKQEVNFNVKAGKTQFFTFQNIETRQ